MDGKVIHIKNDIDMSGWSGNWYNEVLVNRHFRGIIDGEGHTISGLTFTQASSSAEYVGLFGGRIKAGSAYNATYDCNAGVFNLTIKNCKMSFTKQYGGVLFGSVEQSGSPTAKVKFSNLSINASVSSSNSSASLMLGRDVCENTIIENCYVSGTLSSVGMNIGGLIGYTQCTSTTAQSTLIKNTVVDVTITATRDKTSADASTCVGGFIGKAGVANRASSITIQDSAFVGSLTQTKNYFKGIGGFVGVMENSSGADVTIQNSAFAGTWILSAESAGEAGLLIGRVPVGTTFTASNVLINDTSSIISENCGTEDGSITITKPVAVSAASLSPANLQSTLNETGFADKFTMDETGKVLPLGLLGMKKDAINAAHTAATASADYAAKIIGYQTTSPADGKFDLQIRGGVKEAGLAEYSAIGLELVVINEEGSVLTNVANGGSVPEMTKVYSSILVGGEETSAASLNTGYLFGATVQNIPQNVGNVTILARVFFVKDGVKNHSDIAVITVDTGAIA